MFATSERSPLREFVFSNEAVSSRARSGREGRPRWYSAEKLPLDRMWPDTRFWLPIVFAGGNLEGMCVFDDPGDELLSCAHRLELKG